MISRDGVMYAIDKTRDAGFETETRDCFVHALRQATGIPYREAHAYAASKFSRKPRKGTCNVGGQLARFEADRETIFGYRVFDKTPKPRLALRRTRYGLVQAQVYPTLSESIHMLRKGRYLVCSNYHAWTVVDGVVFDNGATGNRTRVTSVYEFVSSSKCV